MDTTPLLPSAKYTVYSIVICNLTPILDVNKTIRRGIKPRISTTLQALLAVDPSFFKIYWLRRREKLREEIAERAVR